VSHPLLIGGGAIAMNPEPIADFFDLFVIGEGEEVVLDIARVLSTWKKSGSTDREDLLLALSKVPGCYIPAFFEPVYQADGRLEAIKPLKPGYRRTLRRMVADLDATPYPTRPVVPTIRTVHDRMAVEIFRGCMAGCRFCQAGMITRPTRERSPEKILEIIDESLSNTGYKGISLNSLSSGDHSCINTLLKTVNARYASQMVSVTVPSLRVKTLTEEVAREVVTIKKTAFTVAPEAGSQRLRDAINKDVTEEELVRTVETVFGSGGHAIKMYFMCGLPGETDEDLDGIVNLGVLAWQTARKLHRRPTITVNVSSFVPKVFTPYQWAQQCDREETIRRQKYIKHKLAPYRAIQFRYHYDYGTFLEGVFTRGDRRLSRVLKLAQQSGRRFDGWTEHNDPEKWTAVFEEAGIDPNWYLRERGLDEVLPWDHIEPRVSKKFLRGEWARHQAALYIPDCRWGDCAPCGACHGDVKVTTFDGQDPHQTLISQAPGEGRTYRHPIANIPEIPQKPAVHPIKHQATLPWSRVRLHYAKTGLARFIGHLELIEIFLRALRRLGVQLRHSQGYQPRPRIIGSAPLPIGVESLVELLDLEVIEASGPIDPNALMDRLNEWQLPEGIRIMGVVAPEFNISEMVSATWQLEMPVDVSPEHLQAIFAQFLEKSEVLFEKKKQTLNIRPLVRSLEAVGRTVRAVIATPGSGTIKPGALMTLLLPDLDMADVRILKLDSSFEVGSSKKKKRSEEPLPILVLSSAL